MAEEIDDTGFYREDFSVNSDWEVFNAQLVDVLQKWQVNNADWGREFLENELFWCDWRVREETLKLLNQRIKLSYYAAQLPAKYDVTAPQITETATTEDEDRAPIFKDLMSMHNNFGPAFDGNSKQQLHPLARLYGLRRFITLQPELHSIKSPSEISFFRSSINVVAAETNTSVPLFVQIHDPKVNFFVGCVTPPVALRTSFDLVAMDEGLQDILFLDGLISMFKHKVRQSPQRSINISVRTTHTLNVSRVRLPMTVPFSKSSYFDDETDTTGTPICTISTTQFVALPFGFFPDSRTELYVYYTWPAIGENMFIDSPLHTDFVPEQAPLAHLSQLVVAMPYLTQCLRDFYKLCGALHAIESFVGRNFSGTVTSGEFPNPLDGLAPPLAQIFRGSHYEIRNTSEHVQLRRLPGPMNENEINQMLYYLFPDIHPDGSLFPYAVFQKHKPDPHCIKSALPDSFVCRLACLLATCNSHFGGKSGMAQLWGSVMRELRFLFEMNLAVSGVSTDSPDARTCVLNQKLQMLNVCIQRRENRVSGFSSSSQQQQLDENADEECMEEADEDTEFFDFSNDEDDEDDAVKPKGRLRRFKNLKLISSDEYMYVPILQEAAPKTEDQILNDSEMMLKMGADSGVSTAIMSNSLLSDMEAFKAANPNAKFEDFIRWHSPKDWIENKEADNGNAGTLSMRMSDPNNTWQTVWRSAQVKPAWKQNRLFDDTKQALDVLNYLETRTIGDIFELTVVPLLHSALLKLKDIFESCNVLDIFNEMLNELFADLSRYSLGMEIISGSNGSNDFTIKHSNPEPLIEKIENLEKIFYQFKCMECLLGYPQYTRMNEVKEQFQELMQNNGKLNLKSMSKISATNAAAGEPQMPQRQLQLQDVGVSSSSLAALLKEANMRENMLSKDYILRLDGPTGKTAEDAGPPQFMRAIVTGQKVRLCSAFTENTTFM